MSMQHSEPEMFSASEFGSLASRLGGDSLAETAERFLDLLLAGKRAEASRMVLRGVENGEFDVRDVYLKVFQPALYEIGRLWQLNKVSVATEHYCTAATQLIMSQLFPRVLATPKNGLRMVACCVGGELHELGMRMVADFFEMDGWTTFFLGASTPDEDVVRDVVERQADLLCISVTLSQNTHLAARLILKLRAARGACGVPVLVGGFPFQRNPKLFQFVGASASARSPEDALQVARTLVSDRVHA